MRNFFARTPMWFDILLIILINGLIQVGCGKFTIEHDVSGTVQVQVTLTPALFIPFFLNDCQTRTVGQPCYDADPSVCAKCMADAITASLPAVK